MTFWIDTHCHLDAPEFGTADAVHALRTEAGARGVVACVLPAVARAHFDTVRHWAHALGDAYALGIHPLFVPQARPEDLDALEDALRTHRDDPRLVAVGEIGLDFWVPQLCEPEMRERQLACFRAQLRLARAFELPVIVHSRRSVDIVLQQIRQRPVPGGIAHAFSGSAAQAQAFGRAGLRLGFGGAATFDTARRLRRLAAELPLDALVLETDAPDIVPSWRYVTAAERAAGRPQALNSPAELPSIGAVIAGLRGMTPQALAEATCANALEALPGLRRCVVWPHTGRP